MSKACFEMENKYSTIDISAIPLPLLIWVSKLLFLSNVFKVYDSPFRMLGNSTPLPRLVCVDQMTTYSMVMMCLKILIYSKSYEFDYREKANSSCDHSNSDCSMLNAHMKHTHITRAWFGKTGRSLRPCWRWALIWCWRCPC